MAQGFVDDPVIRMDMENLFVVSGVNNEEGAVHCLDSSQFRRHGSVDQSKYRTLCKSDWGQFAIFCSYDTNTGKATTLFVDVESGHWLRIDDTPNIPDKQPEESARDFSFRQQDPRDHTYRLESSSWRFDPFDGEFLEAARKRVWTQLQKSDPDIVNLVTQILENFGGVSTPEAIIMTHTLEELIYDGKKLSSPGLVKRRLHSSIGSLKDDHETTEFEEKFGKWGESFPDPPRIK